MRIFDTFPFDGELDLLAHHLAEVHDLVDVFVIAEAGQTYQGEAKPCTFAAHRERFAWARGKIRHVKLDRLGDPRRTPRQRAAIQRDAIHLALHDAEPDDVVLLLDVDEVPSRSLLQRLRAGGLDRPRRLQMTRHYERLDAVAPGSPCCPAHGDDVTAVRRRARPGAWDGLDDRWRGQSGVAVRAREITASGGSLFSLRFGHIDAAPMRDAGRHFSSVDPSARLERKLGRVFHDEWAGDRAMRPDHLYRCRAHGVHHRGWWYSEHPDGPLPDDLRRLADRLHDAADRGAFPPFWRRRLVRAWAELRLTPSLPDAVVALVDRYFDRWVPLTAVPLLIADVLQARRVALPAVFDDQHVAR